MADHVEHGDTINTADIKSYCRVTERCEGLRREQTPGEPRQAGEVRGRRGIMSLLVANLYGDKSYSQG